MSLAMGLELEEAVRSRATIRFIGAPPRENSFRRAVGAAGDRRDVTLPRSNLL